MAAFDFIDGVEEYDDKLCKYPEMGAPEPLLKDRKKNIYRSLIVSKYNKVIYVVDDNHRVTIVDMWDMRREPSRLSGRIKTK